MAGSIGVPKAPIALTTLRPETLADMNRSRIRGWAFGGAALLVFLAVLSWPDLAGVLVFGGGAAALAIVTIWVHRSLPDVEAGRESNTEIAESRDLLTGQND